MAWATGSGRDLFRRASLQWAAIFLCLAALLVVGFSLIVYFSLAANIRNNVEGDFATESAQAKFVSRTTGNLRREILMIDAGILALASGGAYALARRTLRPVQRSVDAQKRFISNASHELRTPLAILKAQFQVAQRAERASLDAERLLADALHEIDRMSRIVEDLLILSRIDADQERSTPAAVDASGLAQELVAKVHAYAQDHGVRVAFSGDGPRQAQVWADRDQLERALLNVVKNAIEHSPSGGEVMVRVAGSSGHVEITVKDVGEGIPPADLPHVFERFYRGAHGAPRNGSGLGLAITHWIVHQQHGAIHVESSISKGTAVTISLPRR